MVVDVMNHVRNVRLEKRLDTFVTIAEAFTVAKPNAQNARLGVFNNEKEYQIDSTITELPYKSGLTE